MILTPSTGKSESGHLSVLVGVVNRFDLSADQFVSFSHNGKSMMSETTEGEERDNR